MSLVKSLSPSLEDYLKNIYSLEKRNKVARVKDISLYMNVTMSSVVGALKNLKERNLINYNRNSYITLTEEGLVAAEALVWRCTVIKDFIEQILKIPVAKAENEACRIEHFIDSETVENMEALLRGELPGPQPQR